MEERKMRIIERLFVQRKRTMLILNLYKSVLPLLKKYVLLFEMKKPLIHKLHDQQIELLLEFLGCFLKPETLASVSAKKLM